MGLEIKRSKKTKRYTVRHTGCGTYLLRNATRERVKELYMARAKLRAEDEIEEWLAELEGGFKAVRAYRLKRLAELDKLHDES